MRKVTVTKVEKEAETSVIYAGKYILSLPTLVTIKKGDKITINVYTEEEDVPEGNVKMYGQVFRTFETHCLISVGGFVCKIPHPFTRDTFLNILIQE